MNIEISKLWVDALRGGEYTQTKNALAKVNGGHCCLGVLCELAIKGGVGIRKYEGVLEYFFDDESELIPDSVQGWAGMKTSNGVLSEDTDLAELNDIGKTFAEIADIIEANAEAL